MSKEMIERARAHRTNDFMEPKHPIVQKLADALEGAERNLEIARESLLAANALIEEMGTLGGKYPYINGTALLVDSRCVGEKVNSALAKLGDTNAG